MLSFYRKGEVYIVGRGLNNRGLQWIYRGETERRRSLELFLENCVYGCVCMLSDEVQVIASSPQQVSTGKQTYT